MRLLTELHEGVEYLTEERGAAKRTYIQGPFMTAERKNRNGRIYPKAVLENAVNAYNEEYVSTNRALGEMNHPTTPQVNPERACIKIESLKWDGNNVMGRAKVLSTPMGRILESLIHDGVKIGVSSRAMGSLKESNGAKIVQNDLMLSAIDAVYDPSAHDAFVEGIMESAEWIYEGGLWKQVDLDDARKTIKKANRKQLEAVKLKVFEDFVFGHLSKIK